MANTTTEEAHADTSPDCISKCLWSMLIVLFLCVFSCCAYFIYFDQIPSAPVPDKANLIYHSPDDESDSKYWAAMDAYWYYEGYVVDISDSDAITFYQKQDGRCSEVLVPDISIPAPYTRCYVGAKPFGGAIVKIFTQDNQTHLSIEVRWTPADTYIEEFLFD